MKSKCQNLLSKVIFHQCYGLWLKSTCSKSLIYSGESCLLSVIPSIEVARRDLIKKSNLDTGWLANSFSVSRNHKASRCNKSQLPFHFEVSYKAAVYKDCAWNYCITSSSFILPMALEFLAWRVILCLDFLHCVFAFSAETVFLASLCCPSIYSLSSGLFLLVPWALIFINFPFDRQVQVTAVLTWTQRKPVLKRELWTHPQFLSRFMPVAILTATSH